jgi:pyruvate, water dikinase
MASPHHYLSTGIKELDALFKDLIPGDNIVWHVDSVEDFRLLATPFHERAAAAGEQVTYLRFAKHAPLASPREGLNVVPLDPGAGFEAFVNAIHRVIEANGTGGFYLFDCLTDLVESWHSDEMLGNFFKLTCPYLLDVESIAYFALLKRHHSRNALAPILYTTQIFVDVFSHHGDLFLHPVKVQQRYSPTMHMLHRWRDGAMTPVAGSGLTAEIFNSVPWTGEPSASRVFDRWNQTFVQAEYLMADPRGLDGKRAEELKDSLLHMVFSRDERILELARRHLELPDLTAIGQRMIGSGLIGGKSAGMLLAQAIVRRAPETRDVGLEPLDSFFIGSDVFYSYLVSNGCWWARQQKDLNALLYNARHARRIILTGAFSEDMTQHFANMLDYFGQAPILVRSSSLLEDSYGNAFSGKYESVFCPNQGSRQKCLDNLLTAIRTVYASSMSEKAIRYRAHCNLLEHDEQMSLLVQRVSGSLTGDLFYPLLAGVGYSFNPYAWSESIDADAGLLRLVFGLGTRAVDRADNDYTRLVALNDPTRRPDSGEEDRRRYTQRSADVIDLNANRVVSLPCDAVLEHVPDDRYGVVATNEHVTNEADRRQTTFRTVTFDGLFCRTDFADRMRRVLRVLEDAYGAPVDVEFTANLAEGERCDIGIVQCRPFQVRRDDGVADRPVAPQQGKSVLCSDGPVIGVSRDVVIDRIVFIDPEVYSQLPARDKYAAARLTGRALRSPELCDRNILLMGPGRWGTSMPELGVPVTFADIDRVCALCEIVTMHAGLVPDVSLGTHFFNDLVECDILYFSVFPGREGVSIDWSYLRQAPSVPVSVLAEAPTSADGLVRILDPSAAGFGALRLFADSKRQSIVCAFP